MADIQRIQQRDRYGCGVAVLAMLTGQSYEDVRDQFLLEGYRHDFSQAGMSSLKVYAYLAEHGYAVAAKRRYYIPHEQPREEWPPEPFADLHYCEVQHTQGGHLVVMLADGTVLDPDVPVPRRLADYPRVHHVTGVYRVADVAI